ncbi:uncharacterized protein LOC130736304 [Lotus japonicus]|uniref:uncharacterized protein LOC130736304 n=1 Tax=Lotus japonicus TaxID=34305 RepID=UPI002590F78A|nr:uncharacterized protein LOC130736304 [Lotus japonicus]
MANSERADFDNGVDLRLEAQAQGWEGYFQRLHGLVNDKLVKEFWKHADCNEHQVVSFVLGKRIIISEKSFVRLLGAETSNGYRFQLQESKVKPSTKEKKKAKKVRIATQVTHLQPTQEPARTAPSTRITRSAARASRSAVAGSSNPGAQPITAAVSKGKNVGKASANVSATAATESAQPAPNSAAGGTATVAAAKSTTVGATPTTVGQSSIAGTTTNTSSPSAALNATTAAASSDAPAGGKETEKETSKSPPRQVTPPSPPPTNDGRSMSSPPHHEERSSPGAATTFEAARIERAPGNEGGSSSYHNMLPNAIEPSEFLLTGLNPAEAERLKAESDRHQEAAAAWEKCCDKLVAQAGKEKVHADKLIGSAGNRIGELEDHLKLMKEEADGLDASLQACKKEKDQAEKDLAAKSEALAAKESELKTLGAELELAKKAMAEQEKKSAESLALVKADLEAMRATSEEIKKANEAYGATLVAKDAEITSHLARIKELEGELSVEKAKATEAREQAADIAYDNRERGFYLAKDQAQHLFPNLDFSAMGIMKEITAEGLAIIE